jgi:ATP-grasp domain-containing protein
MDVLMFSPGYPAEMPYFTRGLAEVGARVWGLGDQPAGGLPDVARHALSGYLQVRSLWDERALLDDLRRWNGPKKLDRIECLWEPGMLLAASLREALGVDGMTEAETVPFRDKGRMKEVLDAAGLRTPRHFRAKTQDGVREAAERVGYPVCVKPIAGAGSADTYKVSDPGELESVLQKTRHVPEVSVEEWIEGEEYTFDTICANGRILYHNIAWYRPKPIVGRSVEWISPQTVNLRNVDHPDLQAGVRLGLGVLEALGFRTGFTHMEWFRKPDGEAVFGEIGCRPGGAHLVDQMNYTCDIDLFREWARAVCHGRFEAPTTRKYNAAIIFKRAKGHGRITRIDGLREFLARHGEHVVEQRLLPFGSQRRDWKKTLVSDGYILLRHPDWDRTYELAMMAATEITMWAE